MGSENKIAASDSTPWSDLADQVDFLLNLSEEVSDMCDSKVAFLVGPAPDEGSEAIVAPPRVSFVGRVSDKLRETEKNLYAIKRELGRI